MRTTGRNETQKGDEMRDQTTCETNGQYYRRLQTEGRLHGSFPRACRIRKAREAAAELAELLTIRDLLQQRVRLILLGTDASTTARDNATDRYPRRQNWELPRATTERLGNYVEILEINNGRYSSRCTYIHWTYRPEVESWGIVLNGTLRYRFRGRCFTFRSPRGYRWGVDGQGIRLCSISRPGDDYHPDSDDLVVDGTQQTLRSLTAKIRLAATVRRAMARKGRAMARKERTALAKVRQVEREGCRVRLTDSIRAGNCPAGSANWARQHKLDPTGHYRPTVILALANGRGDRVRLAVTAAVRRHEQEVRQGFCAIS